MQEWKLGDTTSSFLVALGCPCITLCDTVDLIFKRGDPGGCVTQRSRLPSKMTFLLNHRKHLEDVVEDSFACQSASLSLGLFPPSLDTEDSEMSQILTILALRGLTATGPGGHGLGLPESPWLCHPGLDSLPVPATPSPARHWPEWPAAEDSPSGMAQMRLPTRPQITASSVPELPRHAVPPALMSCFPLEGVAGLSLHPAHRAGTDREKGAWHQMTTCCMPRMCWILCV